MNLNDLRKEIDHIDEQILELLSRRGEIVQEVGRHKTRSRSHYFTPEREQVVFKRLSGLNKGPLDANAIRAIYREIISASRALEKPLTVAYLGPEREQVVFKRLSGLNKGPLDANAIRAIYREIISASRALEKPLTVAYLG